MEKIDLTWNLFFTLVAIPTLGYLIRSWVADIKKDIKGLSEAAEARYDAFRKGLDEKASLQDNKEEHEELWSRVNKHCHDKEGNVVIPRVP